MLPIAVLKKNCCTNDDRNNQISATIDIGQACKNLPYEDLADMLANDYANSKPETEPCARGTPLQTEHQLSEHGKQADSPADDKSEQDTFNTQACEGAVQSTDLVAIDVLEQIDQHR